MKESKFTAGEIVLIPFPFTDYSQDKLRPALVISCPEFNNRSPDVVLAAISSNIRQNYEYGVLIDKPSPPSPEFLQTKLRMASVIMCGKIFSYDKGSIHRRLGTISPRLLKQVSETLNRILIL